MTPVFGRKDKTQGGAPATRPADHQQREGAKNRPTPKRREQEAARRQPLVVTDRKAARDTDRAKRHDAQLRTRQAMVTGDDRYLPPRDKGPVRRYIRDRVDSRRSVGEFLLPVMILVLAGTVLEKWFAWAVFLVTLFMYAILIAAIVDSWLMWRGIKQGIIATFGAGSVPRGGASYAVMRALNMRRLRMPKPLVQRGQTVL